MISKTWLLIFISLVAVQLLAAEYSDEQLDFFEKKIRPVLAEKCYRCHSAGSEKLKAHLQLDHREHMLTGGDTGPSIVPGNPEQSFLIEVISYETPDLQMPPKGPLDAKTVDDFRKWIADGAAWPNEPVPESGAHGKVEKFDLQKRYEEHWSWRPVEVPTPPTVKNALRVKSPIDQFILSKLEAANLLPAEAADKRALIRRAYFDLTGLPPSPDQIASFLADESPDAYEKLVDQLLASPHFGEKWARHWMDLVRYAETYGHEFDYPLDYAFEYRDYLIRAFNADIPYDQFVTEHIAGDLLKEPRRNPVEQFNESILGTGFWYFHEATHAPTDVLQDEADHMDNQLDVFGKSFLGLTVACARCHDHKFDAISTADYYALTSYLHSSARQEYPMDPGRQREKAVEKLKQLRLRGAEELGKISANAVDRLKPGAYFGAALELIQEEIANPPSGDPWQGTVFDEFESGKFDKWKVTGNAFGKSPTGSANSFQNGNDKDRGMLISEKFAIRKPYINFMIGGGKAKTTSFELWIEGVSVVQANGENTDTPGVKSWNVAAHTGKSAELRIIDNARGDWGYIEVDRIVFSDVPAAKLESLPYPGHEKITVFAESRKLDPVRLTEWTKVFTSSEKDDKKPGGYFRKLVANPKVSQGIVAVQKRIDQQNADYDSNATVIASFEKPESIEGWSTSGMAFQRPESSSGISFDPDGPLALPAVYSSSRLGDRQNGILRSPTFEISAESIHIKAKSKNLFARIVIDNYHMAKFSGLLFGGTIEKNGNSDGEFRQITFGGHLKKYIGHQAFLEFVDKGGAKVDIEKIWMSSDGAPALDVHPVVLAASGQGAATSGAIAANLDTAWTTAWQAVIDGKPSTEQAGLINWMAEKNLFKISDVSTELSEILAEGREIDKSLPKERYAVAMAEGTPEPGNVYIRGSYRKLGEKVSRRMLTALGGKEGDRLELARQIANPENPLTSRVMVNRIWHHLFGRGIVPSVDDFGPMGQEPSHPGLLDWLANDFSANGWSVKHTIREILLSNTYRQSSVASGDLDLAHIANIDPDNILLHRMPVRRLQAEAVRDAVLAVSGRLDLNTFGPSVPTHRTKYMSGRGARGSGPLDGNGRRSIYGAVYRNFLSPLMLTFDQPGPFGPKGRRSVSNVPAQALALMNDPFIIEQSQLWAKNALANHDSDEARIEYMYEKALGVRPSKERIRALKSFLVQQSGIYGEADHPAWTDLAHILFNMKEFIYLN